MYTDFHSHILPGMDDGSTGVEMSLKMLRRETAGGISRVVATPHFYAQYEDPETFLLRRNRAEKALRSAMESEQNMPELLVGAEVRYFRGISEAEALPELAIRGTDSILIELPDPPWTEAVCRELRDIREKRGLIPIIAHIDRYIGPLHGRKLPRLLQTLPVLVQANGTFFLKRSTAAMARRLLNADQIHLLGSDCHDLTGRPPNLGEVFRRIGKKPGRGPMEAIQSYEALALTARKQGREENQ